MAKAQVQSDQHLFDILKPTMNNNSSGQLKCTCHNSSIIAKMLDILLHILRFVVMVHPYDVLTFCLY